MTKKFLSPFMQEISERGFIHQCTDPEGLDKLIVKNKSISAYIGFDCTASSLHVGSLLPIMILKIFQRHGHKPIIVLGGGTTKIGDPSGKDTVRKLLSDNEIKKNASALKKIFQRFLSFGKTKNGAIIVDNSIWLEKLKYIPFLRDFGRHFSVNRMLTFDSIKTRLDREQPLSFLEFNYMILQSYDFLQLAKKYSCSLQMGGSDQWGNIVSGVELSRRALGKTLYGLTSPLITTSKGTKMGKTEEGAIWLDDKLTSPYEYWQFWRNSHDDDVNTFLKLFTDLPVEKISSLGKLKGSEIDETKKILAFEATRLCHGKKNAEEALKTAKNTFEKGGSGSMLPTESVAQKQLEKGIPAFQLFGSQDLNLCQSMGESRRLIRGKGAKINGNIVTDEMQMITIDDLDSDGVIKLSAGKKRHAIIKVKK